MEHQDLEKYILNKPGAKLEYPFGSEVAVYKVGGKMFALIAENRQPLNISLKCDPQLSAKLQADYESVMPGYHLNKKHWITIVHGGQLSDQEVLNLIDHSYNLVTNLAGVENIETK